MESIATRFKPFEDGGKEQILMCLRFVLCERLMGRDGEGRNGNKLNCLIEGNMAVGYAWRFMFGECKAVGGDTEQVLAGR